MEGLWWGQANFVNPVSLVSDETIYLEKRPSCAIANDRIDCAHFRRRFFAEFVSRRRGTFNTGSMVRQRHIMMALLRSTRLGNRR